MPTQPLVRILVIDDEPIVRLDAREILEDAGYVVTEAASADEAMPLLADGETTEAILTDINMPGTLDGLELARMVDGLMPEIAIVIMSGKPATASRRPAAQGDLRGQALLGLGATAAGGGGACGSLGEPSKSPQRNGGHRRVPTSVA